jgi:ribonuclease HI
LGAGCLLAYKNNLPNFEFETVSQYFTTNKKNLQVTQVKDILNESYPLHPRNSHTQHTRNYNNYNNSSIDSFNNHNNRNNSNLDDSNNQHVNNESPVDISSNNVAEFTALLIALHNIQYHLRTALYIERYKIDILGDSDLVIQALATKSKPSKVTIRAIHLKPLYTACQKIITEIESDDHKLSLSWVPREHNTTANRLCNDASRNHKTASSTSTNTDQFLEFTSIPNSTYTPLTTFQASLPQCQPRPSYPPASTTFNFPRSNLALNFNSQTPSGAGLETDPIDLTEKASLPIDILFQPQPNTISSSSSSYSSSSLISSSSSSSISSSSSASLILDKQNQDKEL